VRIRSRSAKAMRSALIWARRLSSSMIRPGQTRLISSSLPTTAPLASISAMSTSKARPPSSIGRPSAKTSRRFGKILKRPNSTLAGASDTGSTMDNCSADFHAISRFFACRCGAAVPDLRPVLAFSVPRKPDPTARRLLYHAYGRRRGTGGTRQCRPSPRLPEPLPPSRQPLVPRRCRQCRLLHLRL